MPSFAKWLINVAPETPVDCVARRALAARLRAVAWFLEAIGNSEQDADSVHQLRIWTRRAAAALRLFSPSIKQRPARRLKRTLRELRRAAGSVRDCDVHLARLREDFDPPRHLLTRLKKQRRRARRELRAVGERLLKRNRFERRVAATIDSIAWPKRHSSRQAPSFAPWCRQQLAALGGRFFELAAVNPTDDAQLHELRLAGKRLRYALELAVAAIAPRDHRWLCDELSAVQDRLGAVCDTLVAAQRIREWQAASKKRKHRHQLDEILAGEERRLTFARRQFHRWWSPARQARLRERWQKVVPAGH